MKDGERGQMGRGGIGDEMRRSLLLGLLSGELGEEDLPFGMKVKKVPKASNHIFVDSELVGANARIEYLQKAVDALVDTKTELTNQLKAAEERHESDEEVIENLRRQRGEQDSRISNLEGIKSRQERMLKENAEKLTGARQKAHDRQVVIDKVMAALANMPKKKAIKMDYIECLAKVEEVVTAPPETPAPAAEQTAP